ncbi:MAG: HAMP domain-containing histidine kinase [Chloroflexota bacterium]|nr:HAMP domain-containing histidine kinase [Chloroflexota bacterium]
MKVIVLGPVIIAVVGVVAMMSLGENDPVARPVGIPLFMGLAAGTIFAALVIPRFLEHVPSLRREILAVALGAMITAGTTIAVSAGLMFLQPGQLMLLLIVSIMGAGFGLVVEYGVARGLAADARQLRMAAARMAQGDLTARSGVDRADEIGQAARAIDMMAARLTALETERASERTARQAFLAAIGHDLRTPLAALRAALDALEDDLVPEPRRYFAAMRKDIEAMRRLSDDLFLLARIEAGPFEFERVPADLSELADEAVEALTPVAVQKSVTLRVSMDGSTLAEVGISEVSRAIRNLLDNAIRHAPPGTEVLLDLAQQDAGVVIRVVDRGDGFSDDLRYRIFSSPARPIRSEGRPLGGTGLGLTIAKGLVEAHDGRIWIENGPGGQVAIWIPAPS